MNGLIERVKSRDRSVAGDARAAGPAVVRPLAALAREGDDPEVRELAVRCLSQIGGEQAIHAFVQALLDENPIVRSAAMGGLAKHATSTTVPQLIRALDESPEPNIRTHVALIVGKIPGAKPELLRPRLAAEKEPIAREAALVTMARLGDPEAHKAFIEILRTAPERDRPRLLERCQYIGAEWFLPTLLDWLDDWNEAVRVGVEELPGPVYLRVCDVVVNLYATITGEKLSFETGPRIVYPASAIEEVRGLLKQRAGVK